MLTIPYNVAKGLVDAFVNWEGTDMVLSAEYSDVYKDRVHIKRTFALKNRSLYGKSFVNFTMGEKYPTKEVTRFDVDFITSIDLAVGTDTTPTKLVITAKECTIIFDVEDVNQ